MIKRFRWVEAGRQVRFGSGLLIARPVSWLGLLIGLPLLVWIMRLSDLVAVICGLSIVLAAVIVLSSALVALRERDLDNRRRLWAWAGAGLLYCIAATIGVRGNVVHHERVWNREMQPVLDALARYEARHGHPPSSLEDLVPECLPEFPQPPRPFSSYFYQREPAGFILCARCERADSLSFSYITAFYDPATRAWRYVWD